MNNRWSLFEKFGKVMLGKESQTFMNLTFFITIQYLTSISIYIISELILCNERREHEINHDFCLGLSLSEAA